MTIEELKEEIIERNKGVSSKCGLFCDYTLPSTFPDVKVIKELYNSSNDYIADIDNVFFRRYKNRLVLVDSYEEWLDEIVSMLRFNVYKYNELYETMLVEYNKMENYDMTETGTDTVKKTGTIDNTGTSSIGSHTDTTNSTLGAVTNSSSVSIGIQEETNTHKTNPFNDSDTSYTATIDDVSRKAHTDTTSENLGGQTNTNSTQYGVQSNSDNNLETFDTTDTTTHSFSRHGNIGVLSGQQLIEQSRNVAKFNIWSVIFADVNNYLLGGFV